TGGPDAPLYIADENLLAAAVEHAIRPQATALALFSLLAAISALFMIGQILSRQLLLAASENPTLRGLGMDRGQLVALGLAEATVVAVAAASPLMPIGPARIAEPHPGFSVNWAILGLGALAVVGLLVARAAWAAWRLASAPAGVQGTLDVRGAERPSRLLEGVTRSGAPA